MKFLRSQNKTVYGLNEKSKSLRSIGHLVAETGSRFWQSWHSNLKYGYGFELYQYVCPMLKKQKASVVPFRSNGKQATKKKQKEIRNSSA